MKNFIRIAFLASTALLCQAALAADLVNDDRKVYDVKIRSGPGSTLNSKIYGNSIQRGVCSSCEIEVVGVGAVKVAGSVTVTIKDGKLSVRK